MHKIFISYRRSDAGFAAGALGRDLRNMFGEAQVFRDQEDMTPGPSWRAQVAAQISPKSVLLVLIGKTWLEPAPGKQLPRLQDENDPVRMEIVDAMRDGALIIPLLLDDARMPEAGELPPDLGPLADNSGLKLRDGDWSNDVERICVTLEKHDFARVPTVPDPPLKTSAAISWKTVTAFVLALLCFAGLQDPVDAEQRDGVLFIAFVAIGLAVWAWRDIQRGSNGGKRLNIGAGVLSTLALFAAFGTDPANDSGKETSVSAAQEARAGAPAAAGEQDEPPSEQEEAPIQNAAAMPAQ